MRNPRKDLHLNAGHSSVSDATQRRGNDTTPSEKQHPVLEQAPAEADCMPAEACWSREDTLSRALVTTYIPVPNGEQRVPVLACLYATKRGKVGELCQKHTTETRG